MIFDDASAIVLHYSLCGFVLSMLIYTSVVLSGLALGMFNFGKDLNLAK